MMGGVVEMVDLSGVGEALIFVRFEICSVEMFVWLHLSNSNCNVFLIDIG